MPSKSPLIKVLVLFIVGIILPTGILVYLGILSIRSETLLLQKQSQERIGKTAQAISEDAQGVVSDFLDDLAEVANKNAFGEYKSVHAGVSLLLQIDARNHLLYPVQEVRRHPAASLAPLSPEARQSQESAEYSEFRVQNCSDAIQRYRSLIGNVDSPRWQAIFMTHVAECLIKMEQYDAAESQYQEILSRYGKELDQGDQPFSLAVAIEWGEIQEKRSRWDLAIESYLKVYQDLLASRWDLSWEEERFFFRHMANRIQPLQIHMTDLELGRWQNLQVQNEHLSRAADQALDFMNQRWPDLQRTIQEQGHSDKSLVVFPDPRARRVIAYIPSYERLTASLESVFVAEMESNSLISPLLRDIDRLAAASNLAYRLELNTGVLFGESNQKSEGKRWPIERTLSQTYPVLRLAFSPVSDIPVERAATHRRDIFVGMVFLAAIVILIALYTTWYAVSREIEVAELKARFVASMSHELKTPLSIIGFIGQKLKLGRYRSQDEMKDYYSMISEETERLKLLIDEVLDFSRLMDNRQPHRPELTDLCILVRETADRFRHSQNSDQISLDCVCEPSTCMAKVDRESLGRVLMNLLDNAVKYSPPERTRITLTLKQEDGAAIIQVADEGYGIPSEEKPRVFERFYRGSSSSDHKHTKGVGLGLSIAQNIVAAHHGRIDLQSTVGKGSIFTIHIPL